MKRSISAVALVAAMAGAHAADCSPSLPDGGPTGIPSFSDIAGATVLACAGFYGGNINQGNNNQSLVQGLIDTAFAGFGLGAASNIEQIAFAPDDSSGLVDFSNTLTGNTLIAVHWGNYRGKSNPAGNVSAFYVIDAGAALDVFQIAATKGASNVAIWATSPVPEPGQAALLAGGLMALGLWQRRRRSER